MSGYCPDCGNTQCICKEVERQENAPSSCTVDSIVGFIRSELEDVSERLNRGKGEWPTSNYVRDEVWAMWRSEQSTLERVLHHIESNKEITSSRATN